MREGTLLITKSSQGAGRKNLVMRSCSRAASAMKETQSLLWNARGLTGLPSPASTCTPIHVNFSVPDKGPDLHESVLVRVWVGR